MDIYAIKKSGAWYTVVTKHSGIVQFRSTRRSICEEWIADNTKAPTARSLQAH